MKPNYGIGLFDIEGIIATRLREVRIEKNITLKYIADRLGVTQEAIWKWESLQNRPRKIFFYERWAKILGVKFVCKLDE